MNRLVIYDSVFGNTEIIARAIAQALEAELLSASAARPEQLAGLEILAAGAPTRGFRPSDAMQVFLKSLTPHSLDGVRVTAFDTRIALDTIRFPPFRALVGCAGYAAPAIAKALQASGGLLSAPPEGFIVSASEGPLAEGELDRAARWAAQTLRA